MPKSSHLLTMVAIAALAVFAYHKYGPKKA
jgi:hypothetical protein